MDAGPGCIRTEPTTPPGGGVPTGSGTTSAAFTQTAEFFESCRAAWSFQRPESTAVVPLGKNQLYGPPRVLEPHGRAGGHRGGEAYPFPQRQRERAGGGEARRVDPGGTAWGRAVAGRDACRHVLYRRIASGSGDESKGGDRVVGQRRPGDPRSVGEEWHRRAADGQALPSHAAAHRAEQEGRVARLNDVRRSGVLDTDVEGLKRAT